MTKFAYRDDDLYTRLIDQGQNNLIVLWIGVNDILVHNADAEKVFSSISEYCSMRKAEGWSIIICTEISMAGSYQLRRNDRERLVLNDLLRNNWKDIANGLADLGRNTFIGDTSAFNDMYYFCDGVHLTEAGSREVAAIVDRAIKSYFKFPNDN